MNENIYHVLWIDDEHEALSNFRDEASLHGFKVTSFSNSREGMDHLRKYLADVDGVILDAKVFRENENENPSLGGLKASFDEIARISGANNGAEIPHVVWTGQPDLLTDCNFKESCGNVPVFSKSAGGKKMVEKLKTLIDESGSASVRNRFPDGYRACQAIGGPDCWNMVFPTLASLLTGKRLNPLPFNDLRKVIELAFRKLHDAAVLHPELIKGNEVALSHCSIFLNGKSLNRSQNKAIESKSGPVVPGLLGKSLWTALDIVQAGSHTENSSGIQSEAYGIRAVEELVQQHHLLEFCALVVLDFVTWTSEYLKLHPDTQENMKNWG